MMNFKEYSEQNEKMDQLNSQLISMIKKHKKKKLGLKNNTPDNGSLNYIEPMVSSGEEKDQLIVFDA